jgi:hypothetical protein
MEEDRRRGNRSPMQTAPEQKGMISDVAEDRSVWESLYTGNSLRAWTRLRGSKIQRRTVEIRIGQIGTREVGTIKPTQREVAGLVQGAPWDASGSGRMVFHAPCPISSRSSFEPVAARAVFFLLSPAFGINARL